MISVPRLSPALGKVVQTIHRGVSCRKLIAAGLLLVALLPVRAQAAAPLCVPGIRWLFRALDMCAEELVSGLTSQGMASISGLTFGSGGALYFARPATRAIMRLVPDGRGFFGSPEVFIADLPEPPSGLAYDPQDETWYIAGDSTIVRAHAGVTETIVRDLPGGAGYWLGNIRIGPDRRLYVTKGSSCDACIESDARRGTLLSFALDGGDMRIVARGLRHSADFDWNPADGTLYILDDERAVSPTPILAGPSATRQGNPLTEFRGQVPNGAPKPSNPS
jgi:sugar lactone lactonase YvrE